MSQHTTLLFIRNLRHTAAVLGATIAVLGVLSILVAAGMWLLQSYGLAAFSGYIVVVIALCAATLKTAIDFFNERDET